VNIIRKEFKAQANGIIQAAVWGKNGKELFLLNPWLGLKLALMSSF